MSEKGAILVVDDEESVRLLLSTLLERESWAVLLAKDGLHALEVAREHNGALAALVTDYKMPRLDGLKLAGTLLSERPGTPVMIMSGHLSKPEELRGSGFLMLHKPFTISSFMTALQRCLAGG